jgi:hypothetical protein
MAETGDAVRAVHEPRPPAGSLNTEHEVEEISSSDEDAIGRHDGFRSQRFTARIRRSTVLVPRELRDRRSGLACPTAPPTDVRSHDVGVNAPSGARRESGRSRYEFRCSFVTYGNSSETCRCRCRLTTGMRLANASTVKRHRSPSLCGTKRYGAGTWPGEFEHSLRHRSRPVKTNASVEIQIFRDARSLLELGADPRRPRDHALDRSAPAVP